MEGRGSLRKVFEFGIKKIESKINYKLITKLLIFTAIAALAITNSSILINASEKIKDPNALVITAVGDIICNENTDTDCDAESVASLIKSQDPDKIVINGDVSHRPTKTSYKIEFNKIFGDFKKDIISVNGNHDYEDSKKTAEYYFDYFNGEGKQTGPAGDRDKGYYSTDIIKGNIKVHLVALNSECSKSGGCEKGSPQYYWLKNDLEKNNALCTIAIAHKPLFSSGSQATIAMKDIFKLLEDNDAELYISGHEHIYERYPPQDSNGNADYLDGVTEIIVGTGGTSHSWLGKDKLSSIVRNNKTYGILRLVIYPDKPNRINFQFIPVEGKSFTDAGVIFCH